MSEKVLVKVSDLENYKKAGQPASLEIRPEVANETAKEIANAERRRDLENEKEISRKEAAAAVDAANSLSSLASEDQDWRRFMHPDLRDQAANLLELSNSSPWVNIENGHVYINGQYVAPLAVVVFSLYGDHDELAKDLKNFKMLLNPFKTPESLRDIPSPPVKKQKTRAIEKSKMQKKKLIFDTDSKENEPEENKEMPQISLTHAKLPGHEDEFKHLDHYLTA